MPVARTAASLAALLLLAAAPATAAQHRSRLVMVQFQREHPCPSTGRKMGPCPGYQKDHRIPLCFGGADEVWNLQWLSIADHKAKTVGDVRICAGRRQVLR